MTQAAGDYVLGTQDSEVVRLGVQHRVWREAMLGAWRRAGLREGWRVLDVGAGPGYATVDLAETVGPAGHVVAVERSPRFAQVVRRECERRALANVEVVEADLMDLERVEQVPSGQFDMAWCRWVASFVASPEALARTLARVVRPGGRLVAHEYADYASWRFTPPRPHLEQFVGEVMASWRAEGGEPDVALPFAGMLRTAGFRIVSARPLVFAVGPGDPAWRWAAAFVATNPARLQELGRVPAEWADRVRAEFAAAESDPGGHMITPMVLEIVAERT